MTNDKYNINQQLSNTALGIFYSATSNDSNSQNELILLEAHTKLVSYPDFESTFTQVIKEFSRPESPLDIKETFQASNTYWIVFNENPNDFFTSKIISTKNTTVEKSQKILKELLKATKYISPNNGFGFLEPDAIVISHNNYKLLNAPLALTLNILTKWKPNNTLTLESKYISPEVARGITPTGQDDVFSLANIACLLLKGDTDPASSQSIPLSLPKGVSSSITKALERALSSQRYIRQTSAHELLHTFTEVVFTEQPLKNNKGVKKYVAFSSIIIASFSIYFYSSIKNEKQAPTSYKPENTLTEKKASDSPLIISKTSENFNSTNKAESQLHKSKKHTKDLANNNLHTSKEKTTPIPNKKVQDTLLSSAAPVLKKIQPNIEETRTKNILPTSIITNKAKVTNLVNTNLIATEKKQEYKTPTSTGSITTKKTKKNIRNKKLAIQPTKTKKRNITLASSKKTKKITLKKLKSSKTRVSKKVIKNTTVTNNNSKKKLRKKPRQQKKVISIIAKRKTVLPYRKKVKNQTKKVRTHSITPKNKRKILNKVTRRPKVAIRAHNIQRPRKPTPTRKAKAIPRPQVAVIKKPRVIIKPPPAIKKQQKRQPPIRTQTSFFIINQSKKKTTKKEKTKSQFFIISQPPKAHKKTTKTEQEQHRFFVIK